jgi:hypothetical protein
MYILVHTLVKKALTSHHVHTQETANIYNQMSQFAKLYANNETMAM